MVMSLECINSKEMSWEQTGYKRKEILSGTKVPLLIYYFLFEMGCQLEQSPSRVKAGCYFEGRVRIFVRLGWDPSLLLPFRSLDNYLRAHGIESTMLTRRCPPTSQSLQFRGEWGQWIRNDHKKCVLTERMGEGLIHRVVRKGLQRQWHRSWVLTTMQG